MSDSHVRLRESRRNEGRSDALQGQWTCQTRVSASVCTQSKATILTNTRKSFLSAIKLKYYAIFSRKKEHWLRLILRQSKSDRIPTFLSCCPSRVLWGVGHRANATGACARHGCAQESRFCQSGEENVVFAKRVCICWNDLAEVCGGWRACMF